MRIFTALFLCAAMLVSPFLIAQERIARADRKAMRETREEMRKLQLDLRTLHQVNGEYPEALKAIVDADLRDAVPQDAWGNDFAYETSIEHGYTITSHGSDGAPGGDGAARDIVWTPGGELRELTKEEKQEIEARREEQRFQVYRLVAVQRMVVVGVELVNHRRDKGQWPETIDEVKPGDDSDDAKVKAACFADPWGNAFSFTTLPHDNFAVICHGRDGEPGGTEHDADFVITERDVRAKMRESTPDPWRGWGVNRDWRASDLADSVRQYKKIHGELPDELEDLLRGGAGEAVRTSIPSDRWGNQYIYVKLNDEEFYVASLGKDEIQGGIKDNKDTLYPVPGEVPEPEFEGRGIKDGGVGLGGGVGGGGGLEEEDEDELRVEVADEVLRNLVEHANAYADETGSYPESLDDIKGRLPGEEVPLDPWDNAFVYTVKTDEDGNQTGFTITCLGRDGEEGGEDTDADVTYDQDFERTP